MRTGMLETVSRGKDSRLRRLLPAFLCLFLSLESGAQEAPLWQLVDGEGGDAVILDETRLRRLAPGDRFTLALPDGAWGARMEEVSRFPNGDIKFQAQFQDLAQHSLIMTLGASSLHGSLSSPQGVYQFHARHGDGEFVGPLRRYEPVRAQSPVDDFVEPPGLGAGQDDGTFRVR